jgi:hypothetical protein
VVVALRARDAPQAWIRLAWRGRGGGQHRRYVSFLDRQDVELKAE